MKTITYTLNPGNESRYYDDISLFTDKVLNESEEELKPVIKGFIFHLHSNKVENLRTYEEYLFDFLSLGVFWREYILNALSLTSVEHKLLSFLYRLRRKNKNLKPAADFLRGIISTISLRRETASYKVFKIFRIEDFSRLIYWLESTGEFREEVKRLDLIYDYLSHQPEGFVNHALHKVVNFGVWFTGESKTLLGKYTAGVEDYLNCGYKSHLWKEDVIFCGRREVEYHLSMTGAELMNRAFRKDFTAASGKSLLLPACMRLLPEDKCKAEKVSLDLVCTGCSPKCNINKYRLQGERDGYSVHIIPHSSDFSGWLRDNAVGKDAGIVGVACPLNLITGGLELRALNIPAQCILLDYCGCSNHWDKKGIPTDINNNELQKTLFRGKEAAEAA